MTNKNNSIIDSILDIKDNTDLKSINDFYKNTNNKDIINDESIIETNLNCINNKEVKNNSIIDSILDINDNTNLKEINEYCKNSFSDEICNTNNLNKENIIDNQSSCTNKKTNDYSSSKEYLTLDDMDFDLEFDMDDDVEFELEFELKDKTIVPSQENNKEITTELDKEDVKDDNISESIIGNCEGENNYELNNDLDFENNSKNIEENTQIESINSLNTDNLEFGNKFDSFINESSNNNSEYINNKTAGVRVIKRRKLNTKACITALSLVGIITSSSMGLSLGSKILAEKQRVAEINTSELNLQEIITATDEAGNSQVQLNWKELCALLSVEKNNYTSYIDSSEIKRVANLFIDEDYNLKSFDEVLYSLDLKDKDIQRAYDYLKDLENFGFTPERLSPDGEQMQFINSIKDIAIENYDSSKILPSITIAQAILESNWGNSNLTKEANNLFGIKADYSWKGEVVRFDTNEFHNQMIRDKFRKYDTLEDSIKDHSNFLVKNNRYKEHGVFEAKTYIEQAQALENAGYSTAQDEFGNKTYAKMLCEIIRQYNLQLIDSQLMINK